MLKQLKESIHQNNSRSVNEVHISGDMNLDCFNGRWLESDYSLVTLARMVKDVCNAYGFTQLVQNITRVQHNSIKKTTSTSCIDHVYSNARYRISPIKIITWGSSDHDAVCYVRYSKEPKSPANHQKVKLSEF